MNVKIVRSGFDIGAILCHFDAYALTPAIKGQVSTWRFVRGNLLSAPGT